jgi:hypothetical protein
VSVEKEWRPVGWEGWTYEQRRIWRLEQQLRRWEALTFAAQSLALEQAAIIAELRGETEPTRDDIVRIVIEKANLGEINNAERGRPLENDFEDDPPAGGSVPDGGL